MLTGFDDAIQGPYLAIVICMDQYDCRVRMTLQTSHRETAINFSEIIAITQVTGDLSGFVSRCSRLQEGVMIVISKFELT